MRVLLICDAGDGLLDLALQSMKAGHQCKCFVRKYDGRTRPIGKGLVDLVPDFHPWLRWADLIVLEGNGVYMAEAARWRAEGMLVIGGTPESAAWELDRTKGMQVFKKAGIPIPPFREFNDYAEAIEFVERRGEPYYSKPCSDTADKSLSAKTGVVGDPTFMLRKWKKKHGRPPFPFLLQEAIEGVEFAVGGWFGPAGFAEAWEENHEFKKLFAGDLGQNCGEAGTVMRFVRRSKLAEKVLQPCEAALAAIDYCGNVDANCIVDSDGDAWPLEWTMRLGWPAFNIETDLFSCDPIDFLHALASGESTRGAHRMNEVAVGVVLAIPPYPHPPRDYEEIVGIPIYGETEGFHPCEAQRGGTNEQQLSLASAGGYVGIGVGTGATVRLAARSAYSTLRKISMPASPFWRNDIGRRLQKDIPELQRHGFASGLEY
jgi:phosphoribosylamine--glycine ligase